MGRRIGGPLYYGGQPQLARIQHPDRSDVMAKGYGKGMKGGKMKSGSGIPMPKKGSGMAQNLCKGNKK